MLFLTEKTIDGKVAPILGLKLEYRNIESLYDVLHYLAEAREKFKNDPCPDNA